MCQADTQGLGKERWHIYQIRAAFGMSRKEDHMLEVLRLTHVTECNELSITT